MNEFNIVLNWDANLMLASYAVSNNLSRCDAIAELLIKNLIEGVGSKYEKSYSTYARLCRVRHIG